MTVNKIKNSNSSRPIVATLHDILVMLAIVVVGEFFIKKLSVLISNLIIIFAFYQVITVALASEMYIIYRRIEDSRIVRNLKSNKVRTLRLSRGQILQKLNFERNTKENNGGLVTLKDLEEFFSILVTSNKITDKNLPKIFSNCLATGNEISVTLDMYYRRSNEGIKILDVEVE